MRYVSRIEAYGNPDKIIDCFNAEGEKKEDRSEISFEKKEDSVVFNVKAKDPVALRASLNSITKLLIVYEKIEKID